MLAPRFPLPARALPGHCIQLWALSFKKHGEQVQRATKRMKTDLLGKAEGTGFTSAGNEWSMCRAGVRRNGNKGLLMGRGLLYCRWSLLVFDSHWE